MWKGREFDADEDYFAVRDSLFDILRFIPLLPLESRERLRKTLTAERPRDRLSSVYSRLPGDNIASSRRKA